MSIVLFSLALCRVHTLYIVLARKWNCTCGMMIKLNVMYFILGYFERIFIINEKKDVEILNNT